MASEAQNLNRETIEFTLTMARELPDVAPGQLCSALAELCTIARQLQRSNENDCNYGLTDRQQTRADNLVKKSHGLAQSIGCGIVANGDPRGYPLFLTVPSGLATDWGNRGVGIPC